MSRQLRSRSNFRDRAFVAFSISLVAIGGASVKAKPGNPPKIQYPAESIQVLEARINGLKETRAKKQAQSEKSGSNAKKEEGLDQLEARLHWLRLRAFPADSYDWARADVADAQKKQMPSVVLRNNSRGRAGTGSLSSPIAPALPGPTPILPTGATWEFVGPRNWDGGSISGRVNGVAIDPTNSRIAYLASAGGGVWKTLDGGVNWTPLTDQKLSRLQTTCVAINPRNSRQILVGLGDHHGQRDPGQGIARSIDGGANWTIVGGQMAGSGVSAIVFDPDINNLVTATSSNGVFRSTNGGTTWTRVNGATVGTPIAGGDYTSLTVSGRNVANGVRRYYVANRSGGANAGLYRSDDRGLTWNRLAGAPLRFVSVPGLGFTGIEVAASPVNPDTVYFSEGDADAEDGRIWKSNLAGDDLTWVDITGTTFNPGNWSQVWYDHYIGVSSRTDLSGGSVDVLYSGLLPAHVSASGNANWLEYDPVHVDQQGIGFDPRNRDRAIIGNDGGVYSTLFTTTVNVTASLNANLGVTQFYNADWHPTNPDIMLGGTQDNSTALSQGNLFNWLHRINSDGMGVGIVEEQPSVMYGSTQLVRSIWRSTNGGTSFGNINPGPPAYADGFGGDVRPWQTILAPDPMLESPVFANQTLTSPRTSPVVFVATDRLWRHGVPDVDMDTSLWTERLGGQVLTNGTTGAFVTCIAVVPVTLPHPNNPFSFNTSGNFVYVGSSDGAVWMTQNAMRTPKIDATTGAAVWVTSLAGDVTWRRLNAPPVGTQLPVGSIGAISVNPNDPFDVTVGVGGTGNVHLWRCSNTRSAWSTPQAPWVWTPQSGFQGSASALPDAFITGIARDPQDPANTLYVSTDFGVFATADSGSTWADIGTAYGLPNAQMTTIKAIGATGYLNLATFGRGLWRIPMVDQTGFTLSIGAGVRRTGNNLDATITVNNPSPVDATTVRITQASIRTERTNVNVNPSTGLPLMLTPSLLSGDSTTGSLRFTNAALTPGTFVNLKVTIQCIAGGTLKTIVQTVRLRVP